MVDRVPEEILLEIFGNLDLNESLKVLLVNKEWKDVQERSRRFKKKVLIKIDGSSSLTEFVQVFSKSTKELESLWIEKVEFKDQVEIIEFLKFLHKESFSKRVKNLKIFQCSFENNTIFRQLINSFSNCTVIHCEGIELQNLLDQNCISKSPQWNKLMQLNFNQLNQQKQIRKLKNLRKFTFLYSTNELLSHFSDSCESLKVLKLCIMKSPCEDRKILVNRRALELLAGNSMTLEKLNLYEVYFDDHFLENSAKIRMEKLKQLSMSFAHHIPEQDAVGFEKFIENNKNLEKFKINCLDSIDGPKIQHLLTHQIHLKSLNIILGPSCNQSHFKNFHHLSNLEKLSIQPVRSSTETYGAIIEHISSHQNVNLKSLRLLQTNLNLKIVQNIIENLRNLEILDLSACKSMRSNYVYLLVDKMKKLKVLKIDDCQFCDSSQFILLKDNLIIQRNIKTI